MTADARPPTAIRITRPYASEDEFLKHELETLSRTSITLIGAQPRAEGVVLRFELALSTGQVLVRGEGRVVGYKVNAQTGQGGLSLRFTRLDVRSKALVDKAAALREQRRPSVLPPPPPRHSAPPPLPARGTLPPPPGARPSTPPPPPVTRASAPPPPLVRPPQTPPTAVASNLEPPADREALLGRLRSRAKGLSPAQVDAILATPRSAG